MAPQPATYHVRQTYQENYERADLQPEAFPRPAHRPCELDLFGLPLASRLGIFSGPLLNTDWLLQYAGLGWDVLVYKTVRSGFKAAHPLPNCALITETEPLALQSTRRPAFLTGSILWEKAQPPQLSMTNSFGMPSKTPAEWMPDIKKARAGLGQGQIVLVSVVGESVEDYVSTARMAKAAGAHGVELNLSCPNVCGREGSLFLDAEGSGELCRAVGQALEETPLVVKIGYVEDGAHLDRLLTQVCPFVQAVSGINTVPMDVLTPAGEPILGPDRQRAGICGDIIRDCGLHFARRVADWREKRHARFKLLAGGGIMRPEHVEEYLSAGADVAMTATIVMFNPQLAHEYQAYRKASV
ncbi:MAG TPA: hypothetical protein VGO93_28395 [Candidatus Xenobia bacterium]